MTSKLVIRESESPLISRMKSSSVIIPYIHTYAHTHIHTCIHTYIHPSMHSYTHTRTEFPFRNNGNSRNYVMCYRIHMCIVNCIGRHLFRWRYSVVWRHLQLDCCALSRLVVPVSALLVTLALSIRLRAARCSPYSRQEVVRWSHTICKAYLWHIG